MNVKLSPEEVTMVAELTHVVGKERAGDDSIVAAQRAVFRRLARRLALLVDDSGLRLAPGIFLPGWPDATGAVSGSSSDGSSKPSPLKARPGPGAAPGSPGPGATPRAETR